MLLPNQHLCPSTQGRTVLNFGGCWDRLGRSWLPVGVPGWEPTSCRLEMGCQGKGGCCTSSYSRWVALGGAGQR